VCSLVYDLLDDYGKGVFGRMLEARAPRSVVRSTVDDLVELWTNGNRSTVINELVSMRPKAHALNVCSLVYDLLDDYGKGVFGRMLEAR
jgi:hypothetical protein